MNKVGGFGFVETVIDGIANMNPTRKARKEIFLNDENKDKRKKRFITKNQSLGESLEGESSAEKWLNLPKKIRQILLSII